MNANLPSGELLCLDGIEAEKSRSKIGSMMPSAEKSRERGAEGVAARRPAESRKSQPLLDLGTKIMMLRFHQFTNPQFRCPRSPFGLQ